MSILSQHHVPSVHHVVRWPSKWPVHAEVTQLQRVHEQNEDVLVS